jgi:hypothetical protein
MGSRDLATMKDMALERTRLQVAVMQAYLDGKTIETRIKNEDGTYSEWQVAAYPSWVWEWFDYRVQE